MSERTTEPHPPDADEMLRDRVLERAKAINEKLLAHLRTVADDLDVGNNLGALGGLDGIERDIEQMRSFLLLLR